VPPRGAGLVVGLCGGNNCLEDSGVPAVDGEGELLSDRILSSISPPLPEFTVIWGGLRDLRASSVSTVRESMAIVKVCPDQGINKPLASALLLGVQGVGVEIDLKNRTGGGGGLDVSQWHDLL
jgi:hypothetical protein